MKSEYTNKKRKIVICLNELIANVVGAGLAPPVNKMFNYNSGRPRPTPTISVICFANQLYKQQFMGEKWLQLNQKEKLN